MRSAKISFVFSLLMTLPVALLSSGCATDRAGAPLTSKGSVQAVMTINAKPLPLKYAYAMHRPMMASDKKRLGVREEVLLQPGDIGLVALADHKLSSTQLNETAADHYGGSNKIKGLVLTFAVA